MLKFHFVKAGPLLLALALAPASAAWAEEPSSSPPPAAIASLSTPTPTEPDKALGDISGRGAAAITDQDLVAVNSGNTITANTVGSGAITLRDNALSGFGGVGNFVMNTGHNNNLQSTMSVTIVIGH
ncbi:MAG: hypothetical protein JWP73_1186 [Phenylobacterium sp.]|nr:hypothetical protein [Phenylobacterium sp.]